MGYDINRSNSKQFTIAGVKYALGCCLDPDMNLWELGIFHQLIDGSWNAFPPLLRDGLTTEEIMSYGSVASYIEHILPIAQTKLQNLFQVTKPDQANKPACVGYDFAMAVTVNTDTLSFSLNSERPLPHAK